VLALVSEDQRAAMVLNCGDSRAVMAERSGKGWTVVYATRDHGRDPANAQNI
jgi:hypothetical protein